MIPTISRTKLDERILNDLLERGIPEAQPMDYRGLIVLKPWGYEFQVFDNGDSCTWLACLKPSQAVSMHCHQRKQAVFVPLSNGIYLHTLDGARPLTESIAVNPGVFHSQQNESLEDAFFLEHEYPSEKTDLVRYKDRYGRENTGYESKDSMIPLAEANIDLPPAWRFLLDRVA